MGLILGVTTRVGLSHSLFLFCHPERSRGAISKTKKSSDNCSIPHAAERKENV